MNEFTVMVQADAYVTLYNERTGNEWVAHIFMCGECLSDAVEEYLTERQFDTDDEVVILDVDWGCE